MDIVGNRRRHRRAHDVWIAEARLSRHWIRKNRPEVAKRIASEAKRHVNSKDADNLEYQLRELNRKGTHTIR